MHLPYINPQEILQYKVLFNHPLCVLMCVTLQKVKPDPSHAEWMGHGGQGHCEVIHMTANLNPFKQKQINTHMVQNQEGVIKRCQNLVITSPHPSTRSIIQKTPRSVTTYLFLTWKTNIHRKGTVDFNGNSHQIHHYFINAFLFLCQNLLQGQSQ